MDTSDNSQQTAEKTTQHSERTCQGGGGMYNSGPIFHKSMDRTSWSGGRIMALQSSDRGIKSQVNPIILRDLGTDITV